MTRFGKETTRGVQSRSLPRLALLGMIAVSVLGGPSPLHAASLQSQISDKIKSAVDRITNQQTSTSASTSELSRFLKAGPAYWSVTAPYDLPNGLKVATNTDGSLKDTPLARYLVWKRDQAPEFFDKRHPKLAPAMQINDQLRAQAQFLAFSKLITQQAQQLAPKTASMQVISAPANHAAQTLDPGGTSGTTSCTCATCSKGTGSTSTTTNPQPQVGAAPVPEPASIATTFAAFAAAGIWYRRRKAG
ncbi:MAG: hypothetical protein U0794_09640 [Isosphaeraceae bacterium]